MEKTKPVVIKGVEYVVKGTQSTPKNKQGLEYCIVRTYSAGVFAGYYNRKTKGQEGIVYAARRLWYWSGASSLSQLANEGVKNPSNCKFPCEVDEITLKQIIEVIPTTKKAQQSINDTPIWKQ